MDTLNLNIFYFQLLTWSKKGMKMLLCEIIQEYLICIVLLYMGEYESVN